MCFGTNLKSVEEDLENEEERENGEHGDREYCPGTWRIQIKLTKSTSKAS